MSDEQDHQTLTIKALRQRLAELEHQLAEAREQIATLKHDLARIFRELNGG